MMYLVVVGVVGGEVFLLTPLILLYKVMSKNFLEIFPFLLVSWWTRVGCWLCLNVREATSSSMTILIVVVSGGGGGGMVVVLELLGWWGLMWSVCG